MIASAATCTSVWEEPFVAGPTRLLANWRQATWNRGPFSVQPGQGRAADSEHAVQTTSLTEVCAFIFCFSLLVCLFFPGT